jgi:hypothetical protein
LNAGLSGCLDASSERPLVIVVSDLLALPGVSRGLDSLQALRADVVVLHVVSAEEMNPQLSGEVELVDAETDEVLEIGVSLDTLAAYRARFAAWLADRQADCSQRGIRYVRLTTHRPLASVVLEDLRRGGVVR